MKAFWAVGIIFLVIGLGLLTGGFFLWRSKTNFIAHALHADGTVTDLDYQRGSKGSGTYHPVVQFTAQDGKIIHFTSSTGSKPAAYSRGDRLRVFYDAANPEDASIDSFASNWLGTLILGGMGLLFTLIGGGIVWWRLNQRKVRAWLAQNGMRVQAKFEGAIYDTSLQVNGRSPWRLTAQWQHPVTQKVYTMRSDPIWFEPGDYVKDRTTLDATINMDNPKQYYIDTSFLPEAG
ncbi:MAG TPA: DUF3592 domain-containing protein [Rudaea sp.]|nr:DUF3592 domain-containing protein [Rudaea sp.]